MMSPPAVPFKPYHGSPTSQPNTPGPHIFLESVAAALHTGISPGNHTLVGKHILTASKLTKDQVGQLSGSKGHYGGMLTFYMEENTLTTYIQIFQRLVKYFKQEMQLRDKKCDKTHQRYF